MNQSNFTDYFSEIISQITSVKINWFVSEKYFCTDESGKRRITDSISENMTDLDLESNKGGKK